jgi:hypothetical protein
VDLTRSSSRSRSRSRVLDLSDIAEDARPSPNPECIACQIEVGQGALRRDTMSTYRIGPCCICVMCDECHAGTWATIRCGCGEFSAHAEWKRRVVPRNMLKIFSRHHTKTGGRRRRAPK